MQERIRSIVVAGGGSAGWIAAARIAARLAGGTAPIKVTLVESATIGTIGVGEGTWPTMRNTLRKIGIREAEFVHQANATFKQGALFRGWTTGAAEDRYYHPLNPPQAATRINLSAHWQIRAAGDSSHFADTVDFQSALCDAGLAPRNMASPEFVGTANYAYHLDAGHFASLLRDHAVERLGVTHLTGDVTHVTRHENGDITALQLADGRSVEGDFFIDCTGFAALLIGQTLDVPFVDCGDVLLADHAVAIQQPYDRPDAPIACHTIATAQDAGWIWDIGLTERRGTGHVYSSRHTSHDEAEAVLRAYLGPGSANLPARRIAIRSGHRARFFERNCVAVGMSAGFLEPLEASALMLIETAMDFIADRLPPDRSSMAMMARQYNAAFGHHWDRIIEFLKLHYVLTRRTDTAFWRDNRDPATVPTELRERLEFWRRVPPGPQDFPHQPEVFSWPSYQYVLHGMGFEADYAGLPHSAEEAQFARQCFAAARQARERALLQLPRHRALIEQIRRSELQPA